MSEFTIRGRETHYQGRAFKVEKVDLLLPDGNQRKYDLVNHKGSITVVPLDDDGNLLFVRQYRLGAERQLLELPAGVDEDGEDSLESARREIREETGMAAAELRFLGNIYLAPGYSSENMSIFLATGLTPDPLEADADEFLEVVRIPVRQAYELAAQNQINDGKSLSALLLARPYLEKWLK